jgi:hypothetical protein
MIFMGMSNQSRQVIFQDFWRQEAYVEKVFEENNNTLLSLKEDFEG